MFGSYDHSAALCHAYALRRAYRDIQEGGTDIDHEGTEANVEPYQYDDPATEPWAGETVRVTVPGTQSWKDWGINLLFWRVRSDWGGRVQLAWKVQWDNLREPLAKKLNAHHEKTPKVFVGHSMGGPVVVEAALDYARRGEPIAAVYQYNAPRPGNAKFEEIYDSQAANLPEPYNDLTLRDVTHRVTLCDPEPDEVTRIRRRWGGARHVGKPLMLYVHGGGLEVFGSVDMWQEFMAAHPVSRVAEWRIFTRLLTAPVGHGMDDLINALEMPYE